MKKVLSILLVGLLVLSLTACGGGKDVRPSDTDHTTQPAPEIDSEPQGAIKPAENGVLTISLESVAIVVNGTAVPMPYRLGDLEKAGVPEDESRRAITLAPGEFFSANLFLDENEDYLISPAYYNGEEQTITMADAQAEEIAMITYSETPVDQGVSLLGVTFGMSKGDVRAMLGEPMYDNGDYFEWEIAVSHYGYKGTFYIYFTDSTEDAGASQIDLIFIGK